MTTFDEREQTFERKFALDQEQAFRADARRTRMLGEWAAEKLGRTGEEAADYARALVQIDLNSPGDADVVARVRADFDEAGIAIDDTEIRAKSTEFLAVAVTQIKSGAGAGAS